MPLDNTRRFLPPFLLLLLCFLAYGQVLTHELMMDDFSFWFKTKAQFFPLWTDFFTKTYDQHYNPFYNILNVWLFGWARNPAVLYLINVGILSGNVLILFYFVRQIWRDVWVALLAAALFCVHPQSAESVQHLTLDTVMLAASVMILGLMSLYRCLVEGKAFFYFLSILFLLLALLCDDMMSLLFVVDAAAMVFLVLKRPFADVLKVCFPFLLVEILYLAVWHILAGGKTFLAGNLRLYHLPFWGFTVNYFHLILWYLGNLFVPRDIVFIHNTAPLKNFLWSWNVLFLAFLSGSAVLMVRLGKSLETFALVMFFSGCLAVIPGFAGRPYMGFVFEPNWVYFSSFGFFILMAVLIQRVRKHIQRWLWLALLSAVFMFLFIRTEKMNIDNRTQFAFCENWLRQSPGNTIPINILAQMYYISGRAAPSLEFFPSLLRLMDVDMDHGQYAISLKLIPKLEVLDLSPQQRVNLLLRKARAYQPAG